MTPEGPKREKRWRIPLSSLGKSWSPDQELAWTTRNSTGWGYYASWLSVAREARRRFPEPGKAWEFLLGPEPEAAARWAIREKLSPYSRVSAKDLGKWLDTQRKEISNG